MTDDLDILFNRLRGQWKLEREVAGVGPFQGVCTFYEESPHRLLCEEHGIWGGGQADREAFRSYVYQLDAEKRRIVVFYNDPHRSGDILHVLDFVRDGGCLKACHSHACGNDRYDLQFSAVSDGRIFMDYVVKGPKKDYVMKSVLTPIVS